MMPNSCSHPWEVTGVCTGTVTNMLTESRIIAMRADVAIDVSTVVIVADGVDMLTDVGIIVEIAAVIGLEFSIKVILRNSFLCC